MEAQAMHLLKLSDTEVHRNGLRIVLVALSLLLLETFIIYGPPRALILRIFLSQEAHLNPKKAKRLVSQLAARVIGCVFLTLMFPVAIKTLQDGNLKEDKLYDHDGISALCVTLAAGYFAYDVVICLLRFNENGPAFMVHALGCFSVYLCAALYNVLHFYGAAFLMWELSTPFIYVRWVLLKLGKADSALVKINNLLGFLVFFLCRNCYGPYVSWDFWKVSRTHLGDTRPDRFHPLSIYSCWAACVLLNGLNYFWLFQMVKLALGSPHPKQAKQIKQS